MVNKGSQPIFRINVRIPATLKAPPSVIVHDGRADLFGRLTFARGISVNTGRPVNCVSKNKLAIYYYYNGLKRAFVI